MLATPAPEANCRPDGRPRLMVSRAGGFGDFANKRKVKLTRKDGKDFTVDVKKVMEEGHPEDDVALQPDDQIYVPQRLINM